jgi:hypothetical protein
MENQSKVHPVIYVDGDLLKIQKSLARRFFELDLSDMSEEEERQYMQNLLNKEVSDYFDKLEMLRKNGLIKPFSFSSDGLIESYTVEGTHERFLQ